MNFAEWLIDVPSEITNDPIWKLEVYRLALFAGDISWQDVQHESYNSYRQYVSPHDSSST